MELLRKKNAPTENGLSTTHGLENLCFSTVSVDISITTTKCTIIECVD